MEKIAEELDKVKCDSVNIVNDGKTLFLYINGFNTQKDAPHWLPKIDELRIEGESDQVLKVIQELLQKED